MALDARVLPEHDGQEKQLSEVGANPAKDTAMPLYTAFVTLLAIAFYHLHPVNPLEVRIARHGRQLNPELAMWRSACRDS